MVQRSWCRAGAEPMLCGGYAEQVHVMVQSWCRGHGAEQVQSICRWCRGVAEVLQRLC